MDLHGNGGAVAAEQFARSEERVQLAALDVQLDARDPAQS